MKQILLLYLASFLAIHTYAQIDFEEHVIIDNTFATESPASVYATDIDGDGDMDMLCASLYDDKIAWYENTDGIGSFGVQQIITTNADGAKSVYATDIDGDGDMDVLSASWYDNKIAWYENTDGLGSFGVQQIITTNADEASSVYATDIDGDGDMDVLSASKSDDKIAWYENTDGLGSFGLQQIVTTDTDGAYSVYATDIDGDGDMDMLSASLYDDKIAWYENTNGLGNFGAQQIITTDTDGAYSVYASDIDGDGDMDILSASLYDDKIAWYENTNGLGNFGTQQIITTNTDEARSVYVSDIDGDGDMDVLSASWGDGKIAWHENTDGFGNFGAQQIITTDADGVESVYAADIDGDGDMDVLSASWGDGKIAWHENTDGLGSFGPQQIISVNADRAESVYAADIDGDGDMDVLSASWGDNKVAWYENTDGFGSFGTQQIITTDADGVESVFATDIDGDGDMDVLSASYVDDKIAWYENTDGAGSFGVQQIITTNIGGGESVYATDIDGDGDMDVLSASWGDNKIAWYENADGAGSFGTQQIITTSALGAWSVYATDIDGDGDMDVLSTSTFDTKIAWYENVDGFGNFGVQQIITTNAGGALSVYATDIDSDGDMDVLSACSSDDKVVWYKNTDGAGNFGAQQIITTDALGARSVYATDIDGDGDMDVLSASNEDNKIAWYENTDGAGNFGTQQIITTDALRARSVYATDIDGDGDMDVLSASWYDDKIAWYENKGINAIPPTAICQNVSIELSEDGMASIEAIDVDNGSSDDVAITTYEIDQSTFLCNDVGAIEVLLTVMDAAGNSDACMATVNVMDNIAPTVNTQDITIDIAGASSISITPQEIDNGSTDNCGIDNRSLDQSTFTATGEYEVILTVVDINNNAASEAATVTVINTVSISNTYFSEHFNISPIPTSGFISIDSETSIAQIEIYNRLGQLVLSNANKTTIDLSSLIQGLYFCKVKDSDGNFGIRKVVKG